MENRSLRPGGSSQTQGLRGPELPRPLSLLPWVAVSRQVVQPLGARWPNYSSRRFGSRSVGSPFCQEISRLFCWPLGDGIGPLDFSGEQDALSLAVWGRDGLQLQEVQQHLDLPGHSREEERGKGLRGVLTAAEYVVTMSPSWQEI